MRAIASAALTTVLLAGCGRGGSSAVPARSPASAKQIPVAISIAIPHPGSNTNARKRLPAYISVSTQSAIVDVTPAGGSATRTVVTCAAFACIGTVPATIGLDTFAIALNDKPDGTGNTLSTGQTTATVVEGQANAVSVTFDGVIASLQVSLYEGHPIAGCCPSTIPLLVKALDADGNTIIWPGSYDNPIAISSSDTSGATSLSTTTIHNPNDPPPTVTYNGAWIGGDSGAVLFTASVPGNVSVGSASAELAPTPSLLYATIPTAGSHPRDLTSGPDGALWFTEGTAAKIGRMTTNLAFTEYTVPGQNPVPWAIASGADGNLYFSDVAASDEAFDQITPSGTVTRTSIKSPGQTHPLNAMVLGPDHNLWAPDASGNAIAQFTPAGVQTNFAIPTPGASAQAIAVGADGALWFTEYHGGKIGRITTSGAITEYPITPPAGHAASAPLGITSGPDGALWFIDAGGGAIGRITTAGVITEFPNTFDNSANGMAIVTGPDGAIYYGTGSNTLGRISPKGTVHMLPIHQYGYTGDPFTKLTIGPDGNIWYANAPANTIGKLVF